MVLKNEGDTIVRVETGFLERNSGCAQNTCLKVLTYLEKLGIDIF